MVIILDTYPFLRETYLGFLENCFFNRLPILLSSSRFICTQSDDNHQFLSHSHGSPFPLQKGWFHQKKTKKWLRQHEATTFISFRRVLKTSYSLKQVLIVANEERLFSPTISRSAATLIFVSEHLLHLFQEKYPNYTNRVFLIQELITNIIKKEDLLVDSCIETIAGGREYFALADFNITKEKLIILLKGFSVFKKMLHSSWKLMIILRSQETIAKADVLQLLSNYKYREDVIVTNGALLHEKIRDAYALVTLDVSARLPIPVLEAIERKTPVMAFATAAHTRLCEDAVLYFENDTSEAVGELLMKIYKEENLRARIKQKLENNNPIINEKEITKDLLQALTQ